MWMKALVAKVVDPSYATYMLLRKRLFYEHNILSSQHTWPNHWEAMTLFKAIFLSFCCCWFSWMQLCQFQALIEVIHHILRWELCDIHTLSSALHLRIRQFKSEKINFKMTCVCIPKHFIWLQNCPISMQTSEGRSQKAQSRCTGTFFHTVY